MNYQPYPEPKDYFPVSLRWFTILKAHRSDYNNKRNGGREEGEVWFQHPNRLSAMIAMIKRFVKVFLVLWENNKLFQSQFINAEALEKSLAFLEQVYWHLDVRYKNKSRTSVTIYQHGALLSWVSFLLIASLQNIRIANTILPGLTESFNLFPSLIYGTMNYQPCPEPKDSFQ